MGWIGSTLVYVFFTILIYRLDFARKNSDKETMGCSRFGYYWIMMKPYGGVYFLLQKVFEGEFIHVIAYAENFYFTTYSSNEYSVQIRWN